MESEKVIRVAHIIGKMVNGGVEATVFNYYRNIDKSKYQFDFFYDDDSTVEPLEELISMGARFYKIPRYQNIISYIKTLRFLFLENNYQVVHSHINTLSVFPLYAAKKAGVQTRIAHNHSTAGKGETTKNLMKYSLRPFSKIYATHYAACTKYAGEWLFGKNTNFKVFNNAIDLDKYNYDENVRSEVKKILNMENKFVVGHIGRFCYQKNHKFLIDVFCEIKRIRKNSILLLIGDGELLEESKNRVISLGIEDSVIFTGSVYDTYKFYQAMDVFVFPSIYEGLGMVLIEAQAAGLPIISADVVPIDAKVSENFKYLSLQASIECWANAILDFSIKSERKNMKDIISEKRFDIKKESNKMIEWYDELISRL